MVPVNSNNHALLLNRGRSGAFLFMIPGIGGRCEGFRNLASNFGDESTVYGLHMMGTQKDEEPLSSIESIATQNIKWVREKQPVGPYTILGHSFGAFVAFEMAKQLGQKGDSIASLIILDQDTPLNPVLKPEDDLISFALRLTIDYAIDFRVISSWNRDWNKELRPALSGMHINTFAAHIESFLHNEFKAKRRMINLVMRLVNLRIYNARMAYCPEGKINGELLLFKAYEESEDRDNDDPALGWAELSDKVQVITVPGNHINLVFGENARNITSDIIPRLQLAH